MNTSPDPQSVAEAGPQPAVEASTAKAATPAPATKLRPGSLRRRPHRPSVRPPSRPEGLRPSEANRSHATHASHPDADEGFFKRNAAALVIGILLVGVGGYFYLRKPGPPAPAMKQEHVVMVVPLPHLPPPPPPPPPPPQQKPPEEKMEKEVAAEDKPVVKPSPVKAPADPSPLGTGLKGDGAGLAGLGSGSGDGGGTIGGGGGKAGSKFGWYAGQVQSKITEALHSNPKTKNASLRIEVRIWPDSTGRITRAQLAGSTGDAALDGAIQNGVLTGLQLQEPPPAGMRLPIVLRLTARRPN